MKGLRASLLVALGALALAGCTLVAPNAAPQRIEPSKLHAFGLLNKTIPGTNGARVRFITQPIYNIDITGHLAPTSRIVPAPPALATVIGQLLLGPSAIEKSAGYTSDLPTSLVLLSAHVRRDVGTINLATSLDVLSRHERILAVGQLVLTASLAGATRGVVIEVAGVIQRVLLPNGTTTTVATPADFESLLNI
jgi:hypothetical protein